MHTAPCRGCLAIFRTFNLPEETKFGSEERPVKKTANIHLSIFVQTQAQTFFFKVGESKQRVGIPTFLFQ